MADRENTNNPIPSNHLADLNDNCIIIDEVVNSDDRTTTDRFGNEVRTLKGINDDVQEIIMGTGYVPISGGVMTGDLEISNASPSLTLINNDESTALINSLNNFDIKISGDDGNNSRLNYSISDKKWNFLSDVSVNNKNIIIEGEKGILGRAPLLAVGTDLLDPVVIDINQTFTLAGIYQNLPFDDEEAHGVLIVLRHEQFEAFYSLYTYDGKIYDGVTNPPELEIHWSERINDKNIIDYLSINSDKRFEDFYQNSEFTVPDGISWGFISAIGAGGGGASLNGGTGRGGGVGSGIIRYPVPLLAGEIIQVLIGGGGAGGRPANGSGVTGGSTSISGSRFTVIASGGSGGTTSTNGNPGVIYLNIDGSVKINNVANTWAGFVFGNMIYGVSGNGAASVVAGSGTQGYIRIEW